METANLCKCTNCNTVMIDQNPQTGAKEYTLTGIEEEMLYMEDESGGFWACPVCEVDDHLIDL